MQSLAERKPDNTAQEEKEQRAARDAVMRIRLFPDLEVMLRKAIGFGPHAAMLQHFCYWFHPRKPKMQNRWTLYKTYAEWRDECGLSQRQVNKGRAKLRELDVVSEKKGPRGRIFYRVDWVRLAQLLSLDTVGVQTEDLEEEFSLDTVGVQTELVHQGVQASLDTVGVQANSEEYAEEYLTENSLLQSAAQQSFAAQPNGKRQENVSPAIHSTDKRHSPNGATRARELAKEVRTRIYEEIHGLRGETPLTRLANDYLDDKATLEQLADLAWDVAGGAGTLEAYKELCEESLNL
jgi:hypothetical protein